MYVILQTIHPNKFDLSYGSMGVLINVHLWIITVASSNSVCDF